MGIIQVLQRWNTAELATAAAIAFACASLFACLQTCFPRWRKRFVKSKPVVKTSIRAIQWPGWYGLRVSIENREAVSIECVQLDVVKPKNAKISFLGTDIRQERNPWRRYVLPKHPPAETASDSMELRIEVPPMGSLVNAPLGPGPVANNRRYIDILVLTDRPRSYHAERLWMSLKIRRTNHSMPHIETQLVMKIPDDAPATVSSNATR